MNCPNCNEEMVYEEQHSGSRVDDEGNIQKRPPSALYHCQVCGNLYSWIKGRSFVPIHQSLGDDWVWEGTEDPLDEYLYPYKAGQQKSPFKKARSEDPALCIVRRGGREFRVASAGVKTLFALLELEREVVGLEERVRVKKRVRW